MSTWLTESYFHMRRTTTTWTLFNRIAVDSPFNGRPDGRQNWLSYIASVISRELRVQRDFVVKTNVQNLEYTGFDHPQLIVSRHESPEILWHKK